MCGIVGHIGSMNSIQVVLQGLSKLEYRGYDSAGVSYIDHSGNLFNQKKEGKLVNLEKLLGKDLPQTNICIGHTRWATHGEVNDVNSHPHSFGSISLVHNGIIENANEIKKELREKGYEFKSQTDTESFLGLMIINMKEGLSFSDAVRASFKRVKGHSAFVVLCKETKEIIAVKRGAPLVCGMHETDSNVMVSSDPYALVGLIDKLYFPKDEVFCTLSGAQTNLITFAEFDGTPSKRYLSTKQNLSADASEKGDFEHFMLKEIHEQPGLIRALTQYYIDRDGKTSLEDVSNIKPERLILNTYDTTAYAAYCTHNIIENENRIPCVVELGSEFRYRDPILSKGDVALFISQSGETADTLASQGLCKQKGIKTVSIVNVMGSTLYRDCDHNLLIRAGVEIGVASTKAFTQQVLTSKLLSFTLKGHLKNAQERKALIDRFDLLASRIESLLQNQDVIKKIAEEIYNYKGYFYTGRGTYYPIALEGALKLKEIAYVHAEGYAAGELKHGPIALIDENMVNIAIIGPELHEKVLSNAEEIKSRKGIIVALADVNDEEAKGMCRYHVPLKFDGLGDLSPIYVNVANQLLAYYMAKFKGTDIDKPRNLAKSVTVE